MCHMNVLMSLVQFLRWQLELFFGKIEEFSGNNEDWPNYTERLNHFFKANSITTNEQKQSVFPSVIGPSTYKLLRSLMSPEKPGDKSFKDLVKKLIDHFNPTPSEIVQRFKFHGRFRQPGESIAAYVSELRALAVFCNFWGTLGRYAAGPHSSQS